MTHGGKARVALVYDFDGTLAPGNIQEHSFIPNHLGMRVKDFWNEVAQQKKTQDADQILVYLQLMLETAQRLGKPITKDLLAQHADTAPLFAGVDTWFDRINRHAEGQSIALEHYVVSSGNEEMIRATSIAPQFRAIFGCRYVYDAQGHARWPGVTINYTTKTQFLFRINKGVLNVWDDASVNRWVPMADRPIPFDRMIYIGDGDTDIPSMKMVRHQGGHSIAVFDPGKWNAPTTQTKVYNLIAEDRAHFVVPADYSEGSQLDLVVRGVLGRIATRLGTHVPAGT